MKKNSIPQILIWGCYALFTGACLLLTTMAVGRAMGYGPFAGIVLGIVMLLAMGLLIRVWHSVTNKMRFQKQDERSRLVRLIFEGFLAAGGLIGMIVLRMAISWDVTQEAAFELAKVSPDGFELKMAHKGCELYLYLLHGFFLILGNKAVAAVLLQMVLLSGATLSLYFGIRRLSGATAALTVMFFLGFTPFMISETRKLLPLLMFLIFYGLAIWGIAKLPDRMRGLFTIYGRIFAVLYYIFVGLLIGFCFYLDVVGITLLIFLTGVICCGKREAEDEPAVWGSEVFVFVCCFASAVLGYVGAHGVRSLGGGSAADSIYGQLTLYMPGDFQIPTIVETGMAFWDVLLLAALMAFGVFGFWYSARLRDKAMWMFAAVLLAGMQCTGMTSEAYSDGFAVLYLFCAAMAGCSLKDLQTVRKAPEDAKETGGMDIMDMDAQDNVNMSNQTNDSNVGNDAAPAIQYIENPLPLPKKHKPKVLDYDYDVSDDDDFDLP